MAALCVSRRWHKFRQVLWLSYSWKSRGVQSACRRFSTETKENAKRFPWTFLGSLAVGISLGYQMPKFLNKPKAKGHVCDLTVEAKTIPNSENNSSDSGSPPRSATFNFIADAVEKAAPAVVYIEITGRHAGFGFLGHVGPTSSGSGFIVTEDGMVLTNAHVVENAVHVNVKLRDGRAFSGTVVDIDLENDLAAVKLDSNKNLKFPTLTLGSSSTIRPGEWVVAMGSPLQLSNTITAGIVSTVHRAGGEIGLPNREMEYIQTDAAINVLVQYGERRKVLVIDDTFPSTVKKEFEIDSAETLVFQEYNDEWGEFLDIKKVGNSGGPLVNLDGHVIGINAITVRFAAGISFSIPIDTAKDFLSQAIERVKSGKYTSSSRSPKRPLAPHQRWYIGVSMLTLTPQILEELRRRDPSFHKVKSGVLIPQVNYGSPAHKAGLQSGDIITKMNGKNIVSNKEVYQHVHKGETVDVEVKRAEQCLKFTIQPEVVG